MRGERQREPGRVARNTREPVARQRPRVNIDARAYSVRTRVEPSCRTHERASFPDRKPAANPFPPGAPRTPSASRGPVLSLVGKSVNRKSRQLSNHPNDLMRARVVLDASAPGPVGGGAVVRPDGGGQPA